MTQPVPQRYDCLDPAQLIATVEVLGARVRERFADAGLVNVAARLLDVARHAEERSAWVGKPLWGLRVGTAAAAALIIGAFGVIPFVLSLPARITVDHAVEVSDAGLNIVVLVGAAILFLVTLETRIKRRRALEAIHELRVIAHIIDMHQLTKDPDRLVTRLALTPSSPRLGMSHDELTRYLDYCSEMLSLTGKVAALYVQQFSDSVTLAAVREVEDLTTGLSRKIWQKLMILKADPPSQQRS